MRRTLIAFAAVVCLGLSVAACEQLDDARNKAESLKETAQAIVDSDLAPEKLKEFAKLAIEIEKDPSKMQDLLAEKGISKEDFEKTMKKIQDNPKLKELFDEAKKTLGQ